jgi:predicted transcriptional regulator
MTSIPTRQAQALARAAALLQRHEAGATVRALALELGVTRQRCQQILRYGRLARDLAQPSGAANPTPLED